jgi:hypothetical protein
MQIRKEAVDAMVVTASNHDGVCELAMSGHEKTSTGKVKKRSADGNYPRTKLQ